MLISLLKWKDGQRLSLIGAAVMEVLMHKELLQMAKLFIISKIQEHRIGMFS